MSRDLILEFFPPTPINLMAYITIMVCIARIKASGSYCIFNVLLYSVAFSSEFFHT